MAIRRELITEVLKLSPEDREQLVQVLLESFADELSPEELAAADRMFASDRRWLDVAPMR